MLTMMLMVDNGMETGLGGMRNIGGKGEIVISEAFCYPLLRSNRSHGQKRARVGKKPLESSVFPAVFPFTLGVNYYFCCNNLRFLAEVL